MKKFLLGIITLFMLTGCSADNSKDESAPDNTEKETSAVETSAAETTVTETTVTTEITSTTATTTETTVITTIPTEILNDGKLVRILDYIPDAFIDLKYATDDNFTGTVLYDDSEAYICYGTVQKLMKVQAELKEKGYSILIWDAYRSPEAQQRLWDVYPDPNFVADPRNGLTSHSRGGTVDIAVVNADGSAVELPSAFDEFSAVADRDYSDVSATAAENSRMLEKVMTENGFKGYSGEWWDYTDTDAVTYVLEEPDKKTESTTESTGDENLTRLLQSGGYDYSDISDSSQLILVDSSQSSCEVYFYENKNGTWSQERTSYGIIGKNGATDNKREGDGCTPRGLYSFGIGFGTEPIDTQLEYKIINNNCYWVDDSQSEYYNQWVESDVIEWNSAEHMIEYPEAYHYGIAINYNTNPVISGAGSAIFLHCMSGSYTAGCVGIPESDMIFTLEWLNSTSNPCIIIL